MNARRYAVIGTGALGGYYGARLHHAGFDVRFLLHSDFEHVRRHGLQVDSKDGDFSIASPQCYSRAEDLPPCDVALVAIKTTNNGLLGDLLPPALKPDGAVLMLQNGLGPEEQAAAIVPDHPVLGCLAFVCANKIAPGHVCHLDYGAVRIGEYRADGKAAGPTQLVETVADDFRGAGVEASAEDDLVQARWLKLVWNVPFNGLCVLHGCKTNELLRDPSVRDRCRGLMQEVIAAAAGCGRIINLGFIDAMLANTEAMTPYEPSMLLDFRQRRPLELEAIYANPLRVARSAGVECPLIEELHQELLTIDPSEG